MWRKIHIGIDERTPEIRMAVSIPATWATRPCCTSCSTRSPDQVIASVTGDGAFGSRRRHDAITARGAVAIISPRKNAKPWKIRHGRGGACNKALRASRRWAEQSGNDGPASTAGAASNEDALYESLGQRLAVRGFDRQVAGPQVRDAVVNRYTALGIAVRKLAG